MIPIKRLLLLLTLLGVWTCPASAQISFGKALVEVSATSDTRSTGVEASFTYLLHAGVATYKVKDAPLSGPDTGYRVDLGFGMGNEWRDFEAFHFSTGFSFVTDPDWRRDHQIHGVGLFAQADLTLGNHILVGAYALGPFAKGQNFGTAGLKVGVRLPPY